VTANGRAGWKRVKFGEVVRLNKETCKDPVADGIDRVIGLEHLEPGDLRVRSWASVADGTTFTNRVRPGQVLFGKRRAYQRKVAVADFDAICSGDIYVFESADPQGFRPELLPFICQTDAFFDYAVGTSAGSLSPRTNWTSLAQYEFALPPPAEQSRIAEKQARPSFRRFSTTISTEWLRALSVTRRRTCARWRKCCRCCKTVRTTRRRIGPRPAQCS
jgi:type I restriction enzyme S subunit